MRKLFGNGGGGLNGIGKAAVAFMTVAGLVGMMFVASQKNANAQCEDPITMAAGVSGAIIAQVTLITNTFMSSALCPTAPPVCGTLPNLYAIAIENTQNFLLGDLNTMEDTILTRLEKFWDAWLLALKDETAQLSGSTQDGTRHLDSLFDSSDETQNERLLQETEHTAKKQYQTTDQGCRFDTAARYMNSNMRNGTFISQGIAKDNDVQGSNNSATPAAAGEGPVDKARFNTYSSTFCDAVSNGGYPGCATAGPLANYDTLPGKTLFGKETLDSPSAPGSVDKNERAAIEALTYNITGFDVPDPFQPGVLETAAGKEQRVTDRQYLAQMDAVSSLVTSLVGERMPGSKPTPEVQQLRTKLGVTDASQYASEREIRQSVVEQLWDPNYWVDLGDSPGSVSQKEVYLQAYNLLMLYKIIEKTEKIANTYAIETADMLEKNHGSVRYTRQEETPTR